MKNIQLLYTWEEINYVLAYDYSRHLWSYDIKFYLIGDEWHVGLDGPIISLESEVHHLSGVTDEHRTIIEQREKENRNFIAFQNCRKRTCICKKCDKFCGCDECGEKKTECIIKD